MAGTGSLRSGPVTSGEQELPGWERNVLGLLGLELLGGKEQELAEWDEVEDGLHGVLPGVLQGVLDGVLDGGEDGGEEVSLVELDELE